MRTKKVLFLLLLLIFFSFTSGCLGELFNKPPVIGSTPGTTAKVGMVYTYTIIATDPDGDTLTYALLAKPDGMTINESTGVVNWTPAEDQGAESYTVTIKVSDDRGKYVLYTFEISVAEALLSSIVVLPSTMSMYVDDSESITSITAYYDNETSASIGLSSASYSSDDTDVATVNSSGMVTGVSEGTATITVSYIEDSITKNDTISVTVQERPILTSISVLPPLMAMHVGYSETIASITAHYDNDTDAPIALNDAIYFSNNTAVATVGINTGVVTGVSEGTATITVFYTEGGITKTDTVDVTIVGLPE